MADATYSQQAVYHEQGGNRQVIASGGSLDVESGGEIDVESGGSLKLAGTAISATAAEINRVADTSARLVAGGSTLTLTEAAHDGKVIALDTAAGTTITLPAATGSGAKFTFVVTVKPTSNQHRINVVGNDEFVGSVNILDADAAAQAAYAAADAGDADQLDLNGTTKGGLVGDWLEVIDILADNWHVRGQLVCPAGSNPATPFATGQVS